MRHVLDLHCVTAMLGLAGKLLLVSPGFFYLVGPVLVSVGATVPAGSNYLAQEPEC